MASDANQNDRNLLNEAAKIFRDRLTPGSRFSVLVDSASSSGTASNAIVGATTPRNEFDSAPPEKWDVNLLCTKRLSRSVEPSLPQIGDMPPQPPTFRARVGALLVSIVRRALFWYTGQIRAFQTIVAEAAREQALAFQDIGAQQRHSRAQMNDMLRHVSQLERQIQEMREGRQREEQQREEQGSRMGSIEEAVGKERRLREEQDNRIGSIAEAVEQERMQREVQAGRLHDLEDLVKASQQEFEEQYKTRIREIGRQVHDAKAHLLQQELRLKMFLAEGRKRTSSVPGATAASPAAGEMQHVNDPLFVDHAQSFRGGRADIKGRLAVYLSDAHDAFAATGGAPALDLGCGRGEWLETLSTAAIPATGIDLNRDLVRACRELGLDAIEGEIPQSLAAFPDESRSLITAFHILEHVSFQDLLDVLDQSLRMLKPGGIAIFETPNPKNLFVSTNNFYLDPTHRHPLPSEFLAFIVEARGFCDPKVIPLSPFPDYFHLPASDCPAVQFINDHFYGPQDYGLVARKP
jgi:2-polyprenyl-3-methyl-5-hydroxy-6-metoxy-1,4-benzoquinol methylase